MACKEAQLFRSRVMYWDSPCPYQQRYTPKPKAKARNIPPPPPDTGAKVVEVKTSRRRRANSSSNSSDSSNASSSSGSDDSTGSESSSSVPDSDAGAEGENDSKSAKASAEAFREKIQAFDCLPVGAPLGFPHLVEPPVNHTLPVRDSIKAEFYGARNNIKHVVCSKCRRGGGQTLLRGLPGALYEKASRHTWSFTRCSGKLLCYERWEMEEQVDHYDGNYHCYCLRYYYYRLLLFHILLAFS